MGGYNWGKWYNYMIISKAIYTYIYMYIYIWILDTFICLGSLKCNRTIKSEWHHSLSSGSGLHKKGKVNWEWVVLLYFWTLDAPWSASLISSICSQWSMVPIKLSDKLSLSPLCSLVLRFSRYFITAMRKVAKTIFYFENSDITIL